MPITRAAKLFDHPRRFVWAMALWAALAAATVNAEPLNPLQGDFHPSEIKAKIGQKIAAVLVIEPLQDFAQAELRLKVPSGLRLLAGPAKLRLEALRAGEKRNLQYSFEVTGEGEQRLWAIVTPLNLPEGQTIMQNYLLSVNSVKPPEYKTKKDNKGQEFIEIEGK